jgi:hypothetical protein
MLLNALIVPLLIGVSSDPSLIPLRTTATQAHSTCPAEVPATRAVAERFLTHPELAPERSAAGVGRVDPRFLRVLNDANDLSACQHLNGLFSSTGGHGGWRWSYYQAGNRYLVVAIQFDASGNRRSGTVPLVVFDEWFNFKGGYGM